MINEYFTLQSFYDLQVLTIWGFFFSVGADEALKKNLSVAI